MSTAHGHAYSGAELPDPTGSLPRLKLILLSSGYLVMGMTLLVVVGLAPLVERDLSLSPAQTSVLLSLFAIVYALGAPIIQVRFARQPLRLLIAGGLVLAAIGMCLMAAAPSFEILLAGRLLSALGCAAIGPSVAAFATALVAPHLRAAALGIVFVGMTLANVVAVPLFSGLGLVIGWRSTLLTMAVITMLSVAIPLLIAEPALQRTATRLTALIRLALGPRRFLALMVTNLQMAAQFIVYSLMSAFVFARADGSDTILPLALFIFGAGGVLGNVLSTSLSTRVRIETLITLSLVALLASFAALSLSGLNTAVFLLLIGVWSGAGMMMMAPQQARITTLTESAPAQLLAVNLSMVYLGIALGSWIGGRLFDQSGIDLLLPAAITTAAIALCCHIVSLNIRKHHV